MAKGKPTRDREVVFLSGKRTGFGAVGGTLKDFTATDLGVFSGAAALEAAGIDATRVDHTIYGNALQTSADAIYLARHVALRAGVPEDRPALTVNRLCGSGFEAIVQGAKEILLGDADVCLTGGTESMSLIPMGGHKLSPNPTLIETYPDTYLGMGITAENVARKYGIDREASDRFALDSHRKALAAIDAGRFAQEIVPLTVRVDGNGREQTFATDEGPRRDTDLAALAKLKPAFAADGIVTAGNASQMSDGAAATVLVSASRAKGLGLRPLARLVAYAVAGVPPELMGIGPVEAIPRALGQAGLTLQDIELIELNEAFACQALAVIARAGLDPARVNVNGGAVALGHPLGCTGAKLTTQILHEMARRDVRYGLVTMCVGGGMGAAGIFERL